MMPSIDVRQHARGDLPPPVVKIYAVERMFLRHAAGPLPEKHLIVAVICQALVDSRTGSRHEQRSARRFLGGPDLDTWADLVGLPAAFVRDVAIRTHYLPATGGREGEPA